MDGKEGVEMYLRVIACEIAARELYHAAARSPNVADIELLTQGYHDVPTKGREELQQRIDTAPAGKYDALLIGYGLCSNILAGITATHTRLVVPRAHDCITFFLGSKERYQACFTENPGTFYYTSGWIECGRRRGIPPGAWSTGFLPAGANMGMRGSYEEWVAKYGEEQAKYLMEEMARWTDSYTHGALIDFDFTKGLNLKEHVCCICRERNWAYSEIAGDISLMQSFIDGPWAEEAFLVVQPGEKIAPSFDDRIICAAPATP